MTATPDDMPWPAQPSPGDEPNDLSPSVWAAAELVKRVMAFGAGEWDALAGDVEALLARDDAVQIVIALATLTATYVNDSAQPRRWLGRRKGA